MAKKPGGPSKKPSGPSKKPSGPSKTASMELDGRLVLQSLKNAGMDPAKLNLREILGSRVDIEELQSRLRRPTSEAEWHFHFTVAPK
jgi:hypothetical protein